MAQKIGRGGRSWGGLAVALAFTWLAGCSSNLTNGQGGTGGAGGIATGGSGGSINLPTGGTVGKGQAGAGGAPAGGAGGLAAGGAGGTSVGGPGGNCVAPNFDPTAACAAPPSASVPYSDPKSLASLIVGEWQRCGGPIQPAGMPVAPDGQDGIEFDLNPGEEQGYAGGLMPSGGPCLSGVLLYDGNGHYAPTSWAFASTAAGPGIVFQDTFGDVLYDNAVFSDGGNRMVLTDRIYEGTYVRRGSSQAGAGGASAGGGAGGASGLGGAAGAGGTAGSPCALGTSLCADGACSSNSDSAHCGSSCTVCAVGSICSNGTCACVVSGQQVCNGICVDTTSNAGDCGSCGNACAFGQTCSNGTCLSITGAGGA